MGQSCCGQTTYTPPSGDGEWAPTPLASVRYEVTFADGTTETFPTDTQAYAAIAGKGGGVRAVRA